MPNTSMSVDDPRTVQGKSSVREEKRREENNNPPLHGNAPVARETTQTNPNGGGVDIPEWVKPLMRRIRAEYPRRDWTDRTANLELATTLTNHGETAATEAVTQIIRTHRDTERFPPPTSLFHQTAATIAAEHRRERHARSARALEAQHDRTVAPPWYSHLYTAVITRSAGITPRTSINNTAFLQIVEKYDINPGETAPPQALREAEAAWIHTGSPPPIQPAALIAHASSVSDAQKQA